MRLKDCLNRLAIVRQVTSARLVPKVRDNLIVLQERNVPLEVQLV